VQDRDARQAEEIMKFALFREVPKRRRRKKRKLNTGAAVGGKEEDESEEESSGEVSDDDVEVPERMNLPPTKAKAVPDELPSQDPIRGDEGQDLRMEVDGQTARSDKINPERRVFELFYHGIILTVFFGIDSSYSVSVWLRCLRRKCKTRK
jgi:DNA replication licensing factor MCM3